MSVYGSAEKLARTYHGGTQPTGTPYSERVTDLLSVSTKEMNRLMRRDYFRHPTTEQGGTTTWTARGSGTPILHQHQGIVSLTTLEVRWSALDAYETVDTTGWVLRGTSPVDEEPEPDGVPSFHVVLTGVVSPAVFPVGDAAVRLTGVRGWDEPPEDLVEGNLQRIRQLLTSDPSFSGAPVGADYGVMQPTLPRLPDSFFRFMDAEKSRFRACYL